MQTSFTVQELAARKLKAFERLRPEFEASFQFTQCVHGQQRFSLFPVTYSVRYIHALWVCECKDRLLSVPKTIQRYEGRYCLELLRGWQEGNSADVVAFLQRKLDMLPIADLTRQIQETRARHRDGGMVARLVHGRQVLLNRGMNLMQALNALFALSDNDLRAEVRVACAQYGHHPQQLEKQLADIDTPLYAYLPHQSLARENMVLMNKLGMDVMGRPADESDQRSWRVLAPTTPPGPYAEHLILGYQELVSPTHNNLAHDRFVDRPERGEGGSV